MERKANAMEPPPNSSDELQKRAVIFVRDLLKRSNGKSSEDVAQSITNLALEEGNPVREFFLVAQGTFNLNVHVTISVADLLPSTAGCHTV